MQRVRSVLFGIPLSAALPYSAGAFCIVWHSIVGSPALFGGCFLYRLVFHYRQPCLVQRVLSVSFGIPLSATLPRSAGAFCIVWYSIVGSPALFGECFPYRLFSFIGSPAPFRRCVLRRLVFSFIGSFSSYRAGENLFSCGSQARSSLANLGWLPVQCGRGRLPRRGGDDFHPARRLCRSQSPS